jgi:hypothetical protein
MNHLDIKAPSSATEFDQNLQTVDSDVLPNSQPPLRADRLYQIAAVAAGLILLATIF